MESDLVPMGDADSSAAEALLAQFRLTPLDLEAIRRAGARIDVSEMLSDFYHWLEGLLEQYPDGSDGTPS